MNTSLAKSKPSSYSWRSPSWSTQPLHITHRCRAGLTASLPFWLVSSHENPPARESHLLTWCCVGFISAQPLFRLSEALLRGQLPQGCLPEKASSCFHIEINWARLCVTQTLKLKRQWNPSPNPIACSSSLHPQNSVKPWSVGWVHHLQTSKTHQFQISHTWKSPLSLCTCLHQVCML